MPSIGFYTVKVSSIFLISVLYFIVGSVLSILLNDIIPSENVEEISTIRLIALLGLIFGSIGVVFYGLRVMIKNMPFFLDGYYGFNYSLLREASGGIIIAYTMYAFLDKLIDLMQELAKRLRHEKTEILRSMVHL
jgi:hypothetical protein